MPEPTAIWNPARGAWETATESLLCGHSVPYSETWPPSGSMRNGRAYPLPPSAAPTPGSGSSSWPALPTPRARDSKGTGYSDGLPATVSLLPTPTVSEANGTGPADSPRNDTLRAQVALLPTPRASERENRQTKRSPSQEAGTHGKSLAAEVGTLLLPTPRATDGSKGGPNQRGSKGDLTLPSAAALLLPTPRASDTGTPGRRASEGFRPPLSQVVLPLLPTPTATPYGSNRSTSPGASVRPSLEKLAPALLPTPTVGDSKGARQATAANPRSPSPTLTDLVWRGDLTPPPSPAGSTSSDGPPPPPPTSTDASPRSSSNG